MPAIIHLSDVWKHTLTEILNHDPKSELGIIIRAWVKHHLSLSLLFWDFSSERVYFRDKLQVWVNVYLTYIFSMYYMQESRRIQCHVTVCKEFIKN